MAFSIIFFHLYVLKQSKYLNLFSMFDTMRYLTTPKVWISDGFIQSRIVIYINIILTVPVIIGVII